jgi:hypothetical protein
MLLGAHPQACTVGELKADGIGDAESYRCSCGQRLKDCDFWSKVREGMLEKGIQDYDVTRAGTSIFGVASPYARRLLAPLPRTILWETGRDLALFLSPRWRAHLKRTQVRNAALMEVVLEVAGARVIIDSSKLALRLKYLLRNPALDIKVIRLVRDGRAVSLTYTDEWSFADASDPSLRGGGSGRRRPPPRQNMAQAAREWRRSNESADCVINRLPKSQWMRIRYEDLCAQPRQTLEQLCSFLDLDPAKINLDFRSKSQHVIGNGMRLDSSSEIRLDERWRTVLSSDVLRSFDVVAGLMNRYYGYV